LQRRVSAPQVETAHAAESPMAAQTILRLQRSHGNAFVQRLIQTQLPNTIQRKTATQPNQGAAAQAGATPAAAAYSPGRDARYLGVIERLEKTSSNNKAHEPPAKKVADARAASVAPANDRRSRAQANQVEVMNRQEAKKPKTDDFLSMLRAEIARIAPRNMDETERFKKEGKAAELKNTLTGRVEQRKDAATRDIENAAEAAPDPNSVAPKAVTPMPPEPGDAPSPDLRSQDALPQPKPDAQVSVEANKKKADQMMADNDIDEPQLRKANEPQFSAALDAKKGLEAHIVLTPKTYRREEQSYLKTAGAALAGEAKGATAAMLSRRSGSKGKVKSRQLEAKRREEEERKKVADKVQGIYAETRKRVEDKLSSLDKEVNDSFDRGEKAARQHFENFVDRRMAEYKLNRYLKRFGGPLLWAKDKLFGMPKEVNRFYEEGRDQYLREMDVALVGIANAVESRLKEAKSEIASGRKRIHDYVESLPDDLQQAGRQAEKEISARFDELAQSVDNKKKELAQSLAKRYVEARNKLDERIKELQAENGGLVNKFVDKLKNVIQILANFKARITSLLRKSADVIRQIIKDPVGFLRNLVAAVKQGFNQFARNILKHLKTGLMGWLFGAVASAGIQIPSGFSLKSLFGLVLQILGVTKEHIRAKLVKKIGAKNVARIEQAWMLISALIGGGLIGLWDQVKGYVGDFKEMVLSEIRNWVIIKIVKAAILWLISLFNPASALLRAIMAIYNVVTFFIERLNQIRQLVEAIVESVTKIVAGNIGAAANWIEQAMGRSVPVIIGFLANLLGLTGITQKIQSIIKKIQRPVDKAIDKVVAKIVSKLKFGGGSAKETAGQRVAKGLREGTAAVNRYAGRAVGANILRPLLGSIKVRYKLKKLDVAPEGRFWAVVAAASPQRQQTSNVLAPPDGKSEETAFPIMWPKRPIIDYEDIWLAPYDSISEWKRRVYAEEFKEIDQIPPTRASDIKTKISKLHFNQQDILSVPGVKKYSPLVEQSLPDNSRKIGVDRKFHTEIGLVFKSNPEKRGETPMKEHFKKKLAEFGYTQMLGSMQEAGSVDADHVVELQASGPDDFSNLWPLESKENQRAGPRLNNSDVVLPNGKIGKLKNLPGKYFKIVGFER
jgi:hypothetical protein